MNIKNVIGLSILICVGMYSLPSRAQSSNSTSSIATESGSANFGIYSWNESSQAWVLVYSGYDEYYASEVIGADDYQVDPIPVSGGGPGGGGGMHDELPQGLRAQVLAAMAKNNGEKKEEPKTFERIVVTGVRPSMLGGGGLSVFWRNSFLGNLFGQRSTSTKTVPAPRKEDVEKVTCEFPLGQKQGNAVKVATLYGMRSHGQRGARLRIRWGSGTEETYENTGAGGTVWMQPVPGTCKDAG